jgi:hypothetical protein
VQQEIRQIPGVVGTVGWTGTHDPAARRLTVGGDVLVNTGDVTTVLVTGVGDELRNTMVFGVYFSSGNIQGAIPRPTGRL